MDSYSSPKIVRPTQPKWVTGDERPLFGADNYYSINKPAVTKFDWMHVADIPGYRVHGAEERRTVPLSRSEIEEPTGGVFVSNLANDMSRSCIEDYATFNNNIKKVYFIERRADVRIIFTDPEEEEEAIKSLNDQILNCNKIIALKYMPKVKRYPQNNNVFLKNIPEDIDDNYLSWVFEEYGQIKSAKVQRYSSGESKGFGFVSFETAEQAELAINGVQNKTLQRDYILTKNLYASIAETKEERIKKSF